MAQNSSWALGVPALVLTVAPECGGAGEDCSELDCCEGLTCGEDGLCTEAPPACAAAEESCAELDCCEGLACGEDGLCAEAPPVCAGEGEACTELDCCEGSGGHGVFVAESAAAFEESLCEDPLYSTPPDVSLLISMSYLDWQGMGWLGTAPATFYVFDGPLEETVVGDVTITAIDTYPDLQCEFDPWPMLEMSFDLDVGQWQLSGQIAAPYCLDATVLCP